MSRSSIRSMMACTAAALLAAGCSRPAPITDTAITVVQAGSTSTAPGPMLVSASGPIAPQLAMAEPETFVSFEQDQRDEAMQAQARDRDPYRTEGSIVSDPGFVAEASDPV